MVAAPHTKKPPHRDCGPVGGVVPTPSEEENTDMVAQAVEITHPSWCTNCSPEEHKGELISLYHQTQFAEWTGPEGMTATAYLTSVDAFRPDEDDVAPAAFLDMGGAGVMTFDELEEFGLWLVARATEYRAAAEGMDDLTVVEDSLNLEVSTQGDAVVMHAASPDGLWYFGPDEARTLALALLRHAGKADAEWGADQ